MGGRWDHNRREYNARNAYLWAAALELRHTAKVQARKLRQAIEGPPGMLRDQVVEAINQAVGLAWFEMTPADVQAWSIGHHAGRVMALRLEAYDREPDLYLRKLLTRARRLRGPTPAGLPRFAWGRK